MCASLVFDGTGAWRLLTLVRISSWNIMDVYWILFCRKHGFKVSKVLARDTLSSRVERFEVLSLKCQLHFRLPVIWSAPIRSIDCEGMMSMSTRGAVKCLPYKQEKATCSRWSQCSALCGWLCLEEETLSQARICSLSEWRRLPCCKSGQAVSN